MAGLRIPKMFFNERGILPHYSKCTSRSNKVVKPLLPAHMLIQKVLQTDEQTDSSEQSFRCLDVSST